MKRRAFLMAALAAAAVFPLAADLAHAQGRGHGGDRREGRGGYGAQPGWNRGGRPEGHGWDRGDRGRRSYPGDRDRPDSYDEGPRRGRSEDGGAGRGRDGRFDRDRRGPAYPAPPMAVRPGGYLPPSYRGSLVYDYPRYRLRPPPHGYAWVRVGSGFALVSMADGQIFDLVQ